MTEQSAVQPNLVPVSSVTGERWRSRHPVYGLAIALLGALFLASLWLALPYLVKERSVLFEVDAPIEDEQFENAMKVFDFLSRDATGPGDVDVEVLYASSEYYAYPELARQVGVNRPDRYLVFVVAENTHVLDLPEAPPNAILRVDGVEYAAVDIEGPGNPEHHRASTVRFPRFDADGAPIINESATRMELLVSNPWDPYRVEIQERSAVWDLPITYPPDLQSPGVGSPVMLANLSAGLLTAALAPVLLQLLVVYMATVVGLGALPARHTGVPALAPARVMIVAIAFVAVFALVYAAAGALIGWLGDGASVISAEWSRPASIVSGILVILLGLWVGMTARASVTRPFPISSATTGPATSGALASGLIAVFFSVGSLLSFSGAAAAIVVVQIGALGSAGMGALAMLIVAAIVAVPFLLAALFLSRMLPLVDEQRVRAPKLAVASMVVIVAFGFVVVADNFPLLIDLIYPRLGLK